MDELNNNTSEKEMTNVEYRDSLTQTPYYLKLTKIQQLAYLRSLNVLFPINVQWIICWETPKRRELGMDVCNALQGYFTKYKQQLVYDSKIHDDVDVVAYHILKNPELSFEEKTELIAINQHRFYQDFERAARHGRAYVNRFAASRKEKAFRTEQAKIAIEKQKKEVINCDRMFIADKQLQSLYQPVYLTMPAEFCEEIDWIDEVFITNPKIDKQSMSLLLTHISKENIYLMDSEHEKVLNIEKQEKWYRRYKELAIMNLSGEQIYSEFGEAINCEAVRNLIKGKLVLCKGIQAELDFVKKKYSSYRNTSEHQSYNKCYDDKGIPCVFFDIDMMNVLRYNGHHISMNELEFFRQELLHRQERIMDMIQKDPFMLRRAQIVAFRVMFMWRRFFPELEHAFASYYASLSSEKSSIRLRDLSSLSYQEVTNQRYRELLFSLMLGSKIYYASIGCYVHNNRTCKKCYIHRLAKLVKEIMIDVEDFRSDIYVDKFLTYLCVKYNVPASALYWKLEEEMDALNETSLLKENEEFSQIDWVFFLHQEFGE